MVVQRALPPQGGRAWRHPRVTAARLVFGLVLFLSTLFVVGAPASAATNVLDVPWYLQKTGAYCGPASMQMVFDYWGPLVDQREIALGVDVYGHNGMSPPAAIRGATFSDLSYLSGPSLELQGYPERKLGYAAFYYQGDPWQPQLKALIDQGYPILVRTWYSVDPSGKYSDAISAANLTGHMRVVTGYDDQGDIIVNDPWGRDLYKKLMDFQGEIIYTSEAFQKIWDYRDSAAYFIAPWKVDVVITGTGPDYTVTATATYPCPPPFDTAVNVAGNMAASPSMTLSLPSGVTSTDPLVQTRAAALAPGSSWTTTWHVTAGATSSFTASVTAEGTVSPTLYDLTLGTVETGSTDRIGGSGTATLGA